MDIIPVLDVARGKVVRAVQGQRSAYRPIETPLAASAEPADVARGLRALFPFRKVYVADLDGIEGRGRNTRLVPLLSQALPHTEIWIDAGTGSRGARTRRSCSARRNARRRLGKPRDGACLARYRCRSADAHSSVAGFSWR